MGMFIEKPRNPNEILNFLKGEWEKIRTEKVEERKFEGSEQKASYDERNSRENLKRISDEFSQRILEYENIVKQNPNDIRRRLENIRARMIELLGQYKYYFNNLKKIMTAEQKIESLEARDFQEINSALDKIRQKISEHPLS